MIAGQSTPDRGRRACRPACEGLEPRALLSVSPGRSGRHAHAAVAADVHGCVHVQAQPGLLAAHDVVESTGKVAAMRSAQPACSTSSRKTQLNRALNTAVEAYVYGYPLLLMEATEKGLLHETGTPVNAFFNQQTPTTAADTSVIRPDVNTLYSMAWLDLSHGPEVLSLPDMQGQYVLMQILDGWTNVIADPGTATTGSAPQQYLIAGPGWQGTVPAGMTEIPSTTNLVWILGRTGLNPTVPDDLATVNALQAKYSLTTLATTPATAIPAVAAASLAVSASSPTPTELIQSLPAQQYFQLLSLAMVQNPASPQDAAAIRHFASIGFVPGQPFHPTPAASQILPLVPQQAQKVIEAKEQKLGTVENNWQVILRGIGVYGVKYLDRAAVANQGLGANLPQTAVYPTTKVDSKNQTLDGSNTYVIQFAPGQSPPVGAFWSLTLYNSSGNLEDNPQGVYDVNSYAAQPNSNGSLDLYIGPNLPSGVNPANWLPSLSGAYELTLRLYDPAQSVLSGRWKPPAVKLVTS
jgi:hypothetical protein